MSKKKRIVASIIAILILSMCVLFLWPRSFEDVSQEVKSIAVVVVEESFDHDNMTYVYNEQDLEFSAIMETLGRYSYHMSPKTISSYFSEGAHLEGNEAGYWLHIYLYTEPDRCGECYGVISGGSGDIAVKDAVYRIGYFGNSTALKMMDEVCQIVAP